MIRSRTTTVTTTAPGSPTITLGVPNGGTARPTSTGEQETFTLPSSAAPTSYAVPVGLPSGTSLVPDRAGYDVVLNPGATIPGPNGACQPL